MSFIDKVKIYFGLSDEYGDEYDDEAAQEFDDYDEYQYQETPSVKKIKRAERSEKRPAVRSITSPQVRVMVVEPSSFNDAQRLADKFKTNVPVILNLQSTEPDLAVRLIDFSSGLTYGLGGGMQRVAEKVFLLTPSNVEVSAQERQRLEETGFFNQL